MKWDLDRKKRQDRGEDRMQTYVFIFKPTQVQHRVVPTHTYIDQSKVVFINGKLFWSNLLFQGWGIGALKEERDNV